jgi:hypothetical protein
MLLPGFVRHKLCRLMMWPVGIRRRRGEMADGREAAPGGGPAMTMAAEDAPYLAQHVHFLADQFG